jgi:hypothetical protein
VPTSDCPRSVYWLAERVSELKPLKACLYARIHVLRHDIYTVTGVQRGCWSFLVLDIDSAYIYILTWHPILLQP